MSEFVVTRGSANNSLAAVTVRREVDRIERQLEKQSPGIVTMIGLNLMIRQLHLLHGSTTESEQWIDAMAAAMKQSIQEDGDNHAKKEKG